MKKFFRLTLIIIFALITQNQVWGNLVFQNEITTLIKVGAMIAIFEIILKPIIKVLLLPINILTLGLFRLVINTLGLYLSVFLLSDFTVNNIFKSAQIWQGFSIPEIEFSGFSSYLISSLTLSFLLYIYSSLLYKNTKT